MSYPVHRPRRLRRTEAVRRLVRETRLSPEGLIAPLFVCEGEGVRREIPAMPGCFRPRCPSNMAARAAISVSSWW